MKPLDLRPLFWPDSVAVIGASADTETFRGRLFAQILRHGYPGKIIPVSRSSEQIGGVRCVATVEGLPENLDLAIVAVPAQHVPKALEYAAKRGTRAALIVSSGFADVHTDEGIAAEQRIAQLAREYGIAVCGPNAEGFLNARLPLAATFSPALLSPGSHRYADAPSCGKGIALLTQSGGVGYGCYHRARELGLPFTHVVAVGNQAALDILDVADFLLDDEETGVVALLIEAFKQPAKFAAVVSKARAANKELVIAKMGRSVTGAKAAASHTGALAGSSASYDAVFAKTGVLVAEDMEEFIDLMAMASYYGTKSRATKRIAIVTPSGGAGIWLADLCEAEGLDLPPPSHATRAQLAAFLPPYASLGNPIDLTAQGLIETGYARSLDVLVQSGDYDAFLVACTTIRSALIDKDLAALRNVRERSDLPIAFCSYTGLNTDLVHSLARIRIPCFANMRSACRAMRALTEHRQPPSSVPDVVVKGAAAPQVEPGLQVGRELLCEYEAKEMLARHGVLEYAGLLARSAEEAGQLVERLAVPCALKIQSTSIPHKTEAGGVLLNVRTRAAASDGFNELMRRGYAYRPDAQIQGVLVEPMAQPGIEMIVGVQRDPDFGPMLMVGAGGVFVELFRDVVLLPLPCTRDEVLVRLGELRVFKLLKGFRGRAPHDIDAFLSMIESLSNFVTANAEQLAEIDLNPVLVHEAGMGVTVVDSLIVPAWQHAGRRHAGAPR